MQHQRAGIGDPAAAHRAGHGGRHAAAHAARGHHGHHHHERENQREARQRLVPSRPKMKVSAMATKVCATITAVVGPASFSRLGPMGAVSRGWDTARLPNFCAYAHYQGARLCHLTKPAHRISFSP